MIATSELKEIDWNAMALWQIMSNTYLIKGTHAQSYYSNTLNADIFVKHVFQTRTSK